jgi:hypothetical protein
VLYSIKQFVFAVKEKRRVDDNNIGVRAGIVLSEHVLLDFHITHVDKVIWYCLLELTGPTPAGPPDLMDRPA